MTRTKPAAASLVLVLALVAAPEASAFWNPFKKLESFFQKLNAMNQGATVKERWQNLIKAGGGAGAPGGSSFAPGVGGETDAPAAPGASSLASAEAAPEETERLRDLLSRSAREAAAIEDASERREATSRLLASWGQGLDSALASRDPDLLEELWEPIGELYSLDPEAAHGIAIGVAGKHPGPDGRGLVRQSARARAAVRFSAR